MNYLDNRYEYTECNFGMYEDYRKEPDYDWGPRSSDELLTLARHSERFIYPAELLASKLGLCIIVEPEYLEIVEPVSGETFAEVLSWREAHLWLAGYNNVMGSQSI